jgi:hypothetical protein
MDIAREAINADMAERGVDDDAKLRGDTTRVTAVEAQGIRLSNIVKVLKKVR